MIKPLSQQTSEDLCAQQVITSLPDIIKQLVDNSIDAKATYIKITLHDYGKKKIEVMDNGMGIDNFDFLGKKGTTSKNRQDQRIDFLGFRGEAVHSIGKVSQNMVIQSKCAKDGHRRIFNVVTQQLQQFKEARLCHSQFNFHNPNRQGSRSTGTKVSIQGIFARLPVRQIELKNKYKEFLKRTNELIKQFTLIYPEIQFIFINFRQNNKEDVLIQTSCSKLFNQITWIERIQQIDDKLGKSLVYVQGKNFQGFVLKKIESGSSRQNAFLKKHQHYCFVNRRPIDPLPALLTSLNELYKKYNNNTKYAFILNLKLQHDQIDLNLSPNKRQVFVRKVVLESIIEQLKNEISKKVIEDIPTLSKLQNKEQTNKKNSQTEITSYGQARVIVNHVDQRKSIFIPQIEPQIKAEPSIRLTSFNSNEMSNPFAKGSQKKDVKSTQERFDDIEVPKIKVDQQKLKQKWSSINTKFSGIKRTSSGTTYPKIISNDPVSSEELQFARKKAQQTKIINEKQDARRRAEFMKQIDEVKLQQNQQPLVNKPVYVLPSKQNKPKIVHQQTRKQQNGKKNDIKETLISQAEQRIQHEQKEQMKMTEHRNQSIEERIKSKLCTNMTGIFDKFKSMKINNNPQMISKEPSFQKSIESKGNDEPKLKIEQEMNSSLNAQLGEMAPKSIKKQDFQNFDILGQFNKGFVICKFQGKFYMVDQHAADQKYQYEKTLAKSKNFQIIACFQQKEVTSIQIDEIQQANEYLQSAGYQYEIIDRALLKLRRCPIFRQKKLGMDFFEEIVAGKKPIQTTQKFSSMCAMIACRSAIKVGETLRTQQMVQVVSNLSTLASPWNCPHGRPTLIELGSIPILIDGDSKKKQYFL